MDKILSSKCESCGNSMVFNPENQGLHCAHCGGMQVINAETGVGKKQYNTLSKVAKNTNASVTHECDTCGAKTNVQDSKVSGVCPYCGSSNLHELAESIEFNPDGIVPFAISKQKAREQYKKWIKTRKFVPNKLKSDAKINKMEGIYFPCWNYDFNTFTTYSGVGIENHTRTVRRRGPNGETIVDHEHYTTRHPFSGSRQDEFKNHLQVANSQINQYELEGLGRFGVDENLKVYNPAYILGFVSSGFTYDVHAGYNNAECSARRTIENRIKREHDYDSYASFNMKANFSDVAWNYVYLPVWVCGFKFGKKDYKFLVNGYTGFVNGKVPRSGWKIFSLVMGILVGVAAIVLGIIASSGGF